MPLDTTPPEERRELSFRLTTIGNGYLVQMEARPTSNDPMGARCVGAPLYIRDLADLGTAVDELLRLLQQHERDSDGLRRALNGGE